MQRKACVLELKKEHTDRATTIAKEKKYKTEKSIIEFFRWINLKNRNEIVYAVYNMRHMWENIEGMYIQFGRYLLYK